MTRATPPFRGGRNVAMQAPAQQFATTVEAYRRLGTPVLEQGESHASFDFGPIRLHVDKVTGLDRSEVRLGLITTDSAAAAPAVGPSGFVRS